MIMAPGSPNSCSCQVTKVSHWWSGMQKTSVLPVSCSTIQYTHYPPETCPRLYFHLLLNIDSLISTVIPLLPNLKLPFKIYMEQMLQILPCTVMMVQNDNLVSKESFVGFTNGPQVDDIQPLCKSNIHVFKEKSNPDWSMLSAVIRWTFPDVTISSVLPFY